jgi:hypothetical protein
VVLQSYLVTGLAVTPVAVHLLQHALQQTGFNAEPVLFAVEFSASIVGGRLDGGISRRPGASTTPYGLPELLSKRFLWANTKGRVYPNQIEMTQDAAWLRSRGLVRGAGMHRLETHRELCQVLSLSHRLEAEP